MQKGASPLKARQQSVRARPLMCVCACAKHKCCLACQASEDPCSGVASLGCAKPAPVAQPWQRRTFLYQLLEGVEPLQRCGQRREA